MSKSRPRNCSYILFKEGNSQDLVSFLVLFIFPLETERVIYSLVVTMIHRITKETSSFSVCVWFKVIHLGWPCPWAAAMLEQCWVCIYRLESVSFWLCLLYFKESMRRVAMTAFLDGCINKVTSTFPTCTEPGIAEGKMFQIVPILCKETSKSE